MHISTYLRALRKSWWLILAITLLGVAGGILRNVTTTPVYASSVTFYVGTPGGTNQNSQYSNSQFAQNAANSYAMLLSSERLASLVIADTGLKVKPGLIQGETSGSVPINTVFVKATIKDTSKSRALLIAQGIARQLPQMVNQLDNVGLAKPAVVLSVTSDPTIDPTPVSPRTNLNIALGLGVGLLLGLVLAVVRELRDTSVRTPAQLHEMFDDPDLGDIGAIPYDATVRTAPLIIGEAANTRRAEAMRQIRTNLEFINVDRPPRVIMLTSATAAEGKSTSATNLALAFAETHRNVLLVEADMRRPRVTDMLNVERVVGLSNVLAGQLQVETALQRWGPNLRILPSGPTPPNASAMISSGRMAGLVNDLRRQFDVIIIDTPPLLPVTDAALMSTLVDAVVIVARHGKISRTQLTTAVKSLQAVKAPIVGFVLNMIPRSQAKQYGGQYDGYGYKEDGRDADEADDFALVAPSAGEHPYEPAPSEQPAARAGWGDAEDALSRLEQSLVEMRDTRRYRSWGTSAPGEDDGDQPSDAPAEQTADDAGSDAGHGPAGNGSAGSGGAASNGGGSGPSDQAGGGRPGPGHRRPGNGRGSRPESARRTRG